jgi:farnesyl diphosphate synthase
LSQSQYLGIMVPCADHCYDCNSYTRIIFNKTAIYTFFLPIAAGMRLVGANSEEEISSARDISTQIGLKFQIQDDWLDAFGVDIGKDGTDIQV